MMGKIEDFLNWLSGDDGGKGGGGSTFSTRRYSRGKVDARQRTRQMLFKLKLQIKRMQKQQRKLEFQAEKSKKKAIEAKRNGDEERAKMYAREMVKYRKLSANMLNFITGLEGMKFKLEQVSETQNMARMFQSIDESLKGMNMEISVPEIQESLDSINNTMTELDASLEITQEGVEISMGGDVPESDVIQAMDEIDAELATEGLELPSVAGGTIENEKIKSWQEKLDSLKD